MRFDFRRMDAAAARTVLAWRYEPPYDVYNAAVPGEPATRAALAALLDPTNDYRAAVAAGAADDGAVAGFCCLGPDARVAGGRHLYARCPALDVGAGLRPDLTGRGVGAAFLGAVVALAERAAGGAPLRATVAAFNRRARRACEHAGFREVGRFRQEGSGREFVILLRVAPRGAGERITAPAERIADGGCGGNRYGRSQVSSSVSPLYVPR
jgi:RimJ/RimL family protein N-acetyltransferase